MIRQGMTIYEAAQQWVGEFNAIPYAVVEKLAQLNIDDVYEITPPSLNDQVCICSGEYDGKYGEIVDTARAKDGIFTIRLYESDLEVEVNKDDFEVERDGFLPTWGTLWSFGSRLDDCWLEEEGLQAMADCGFRIYEQEDFEHIFGIDGAGYDFYSEHWIPLYKARGMQWHDEKTLESEERAI